MSNRHCEERSELNRHREEQSELNRHREEQSDAAIPWRTGFRSQRDCFVTVFLAMTACVVTFVIALAAYAGEAAPAAEDPVLESRVSALASELRCLVCQNQTIADSNAPLAVDLRNEIREKIRKGESESQIVDFMTERYGDFVLYRPPLRATTVLLWSGPLLLLAGGLFLLYRRLKAPARAAEPELSDADRERAQKLLAGANEEERA